MRLNVPRPDVDRQRRAALPFHDRRELPAADQRIGQAAIQPRLALAEGQLEDAVRVDDVRVVVERVARVELRPVVVEERLDAVLAVSADGVGSRFAQGVVDLAENPVPELTTQLDLKGVVVLERGIAMYSEA